MVDEGMQPIYSFEVGEFKAPKPNDLITFESSNNWWKILMVHQTTDEDELPTMILKVIPAEDINLVSISLTKKCLSVYGKLTDKLTEFLGKK